MTHGLASPDIRALLRLLSELRELGADPGAWRSHLTSSLEELCDARVSVISELRVNPAPPVVTTNCSEVVTPLQIVDCGLDPGQRERFYRELYFTDHTTDDALASIVPLYGTSFTVSRAEVIDDWGWDHSFSANERFRSLDCDDFVMSMQPVSRLGVISSMEIYRPLGRRFGARERLLVELLHEEIAKDWNQASGREGVRLTPRQRQVLEQLLEGASEKEIAYALGVSLHTAHDHVKAIHRAYGARSRGELLARVTKLMRESPPRIHLVAERASATA